MPIRLDFNRNFKFLHLTKEEISKFKLADLYKKVNELTGIPVDNINLAHCGVPMNDKNAYLSQYRINEDSELIFVGDINEETKDNDELESQEKELITKVRSTLDDALGRIQLEVDQYPVQIQQYLKSNYSPTNQQQELKQLKQQYLKLSETLLQAILKLDLIDNSKNFVGVRDERKKAILFINNLLKRLDEAKAKL
ncbi:hypothetical protein CONCODRAFT_76873 [Conidiobolus coronatus NRRL 28638]|uniref:BAG domain-containing protein n=1 Tax=Conidiobolus coronatus (strain ATCC 28846 / CBS 209.66 / NRRL 28638) TaxID=796925 RepID=A0A137PHL8_CONC2|nr:hypothetical protein CONCODRAFT_76873 [Conidiobolus coronatus NRRL 28638]|eukprot:KXN74497.1 hypothetical protein CONCODRAFT_76873 [Conidiobolus coronatus NRRL 28638]